MLDVYKLFIRICTDYCSAAFHSTLTLEQSNKIKRIQKTCLLVILGKMYISYTSALEMCGLSTLFSRREKRCLEFSLRCLKNKRTRDMFPLKPKYKQDIRTRDIFEVNFSRTTAYKNSTIPFCQRMLNDHFSGNTRGLGRVRYYVIYE